MHTGGDGMRKLQLIALFMSMLIITMPICFADSLQITSISGKDGIWKDPNAYMAKKDYLIVVVEAQRDDGAAVTPASIKIKIGAGDFEEEFDKCTLISGTKYNCTYRVDERTWTGGLTNAEIRCYNMVCEPKSVGLIVDDLGPTAQFLDKPVQQGLNVSLQYSITDLAYTGAKTSYCTGIKKVEFYDGTTLIYTKNIDTEDCFIPQQSASFFMGGTGSKTITIKAYDLLRNAGQPAESESFTLDHEEPEIVVGSFMLSYDGVKINRISSSGMTLSAEVTLKSDNGILDDLAYADFSALSTDASMKNVTGVCSRAGLLYTCEWGNLNINKAGDASRVKIYASDDIGNLMIASPSPSPVSIESTAPALHGTDFILIKNGKKLLGVSEDGDFADVYANFTDMYPGVDTDKVFADFTGLNSNPNYANTPSSSCQRHIVCTEVGEGDTCLGQIKDDYYSCVWRDIPVKISQTGTKNVVFDVSDMFGNRAAVRQSCAIALDGTAPVIKHLGVGREHARDGKNWLKPSSGTMLTVVAEETGSGISGENVKFKYRGHDVSGDINCTQKSGEWTCRLKWNTVANPDQAIEVMLEDDVGNAAAANNEMTVDEYKPVLNSIKIYSESPGFFAAGDSSLTIIANLTDASGFMNDNNEATPSADLSKVFTKDYSSVHPAACSQSGEDWICRWQISDEIRAGARTAEINFNFTDVAGNILTYKDEIEINDVEDAEPDFFTLEINKDYIIPIEKYTFESISGNYLLQIPFTVKSNGRCVDPELYGPRMYGDCGGDLVSIDKQSGFGFVQRLIGEDSNVDFTKQDFPLGNCRLKFYARCGTKVYSEPETENISVSVPLVNEFENPGDKIEAKVEKIKKDQTSKFQDGVKWLENFLQLAQKLCNIKNSFMSMIAAIQGLKVVADAFEATHFAPLEAIGRTINKAATWADDKIDGTGATKAGGWWRKLEKGINIFCFAATCAPQPELHTAAEMKALEEQHKKPKEDYKPGYCNMAKDWIAANVGNLTSTNKKGEVINRSVGAVFEQYIFTTSALELSKKSYLFSLACFCLPGLLYNLQKIRQLNCARGVCLRDYTASGMYSVKDCNDQFVYDRCVYIQGQWTTVLFSTMISDIMKLIVDAAKDPTKYMVAAAWHFGKIGLRKACDATKPTVAPEPVTRAIARGLTCIPYAAMIGWETVEGFIQMGESIKYFNQDPVEVDWCDKLYNPQVKQDEGTS
jgi:hypothetical protein